MNPTILLPFDGQIGPDIGYGWKCARMSGEDVAVWINDRTFPTWPSRPTAVQLHSVTQSHLFLLEQDRARAARQMRTELHAGRPEHLLCDATQGLQNVDGAELEAWRDWPGTKLSPKWILGEGLAAASAWQCVAAIDTLRQRQHPVAIVSVVGCNQQAIGARFVISNPKSQNSNPSE